MATLLITDLALGEGDSFERVRGETQECSLVEFLAANHEDEETCAAVRALQPGESIEIGGGAAPLVEVRRSWAGERVEHAHRSPARVVGAWSLSNGVEMVDLRSEGRFAFFCIPRIEFDAQWRWAPPPVEAHGPTALRDLARELPDTRGDLERLFPGGQS